MNSERLQKLTENYVFSNHKVIPAMCKPLSIQAKAVLFGMFEVFGRK